MERKRILIPNGNPSELQLINAAHQLGLYVITSGYNRNAPSHVFSDQYIPADFSDKEALLSLAREQRIDYICSNSNDIALISVAYVSEALGLPGHDSYDTTLQLHHKDSFKRLASRLGLHVAEGKSFCQREAAVHYAAALPYKCIIKPVDLVGGNGITTATTSSEKIAAIDKAFHDSLVKRIIVEKYINGSSHSLSTFIVNKKVVNYFSDNEYALGKPFKISTSTSPATGFSSVREMLIQDIESVAEALDLVDGRLHIQYLMSDGKPYILEMTRRISGDLYSVPESFSLGFNTAYWYLRAECGMDVKSVPRAIQKGMYGRHCITANRTGITNGILIAPELDACVKQKWLWNAWNRRIEVPENDILGLLFFDFESESQRQHVIENLHRYITVNITDFEKESKQ